MPATAMGINLRWRHKLTTPATIAMSKIQPM